MTRVKTIIVTEEEREQFNLYMHMIGYSYVNLLTKTTKPHFIVLDMDYKRIRVIGDRRGYWFFEHKAPYIPIRTLIETGLPIKVSMLKRGDTCYARNSIEDLYKETKFKGFFPFFASSYLTELGRFKECLPTVASYKIEGGV